MESTNILRKNIVYEEGDVPAFMRIKESQSWFRVIFWYIIFIAFMTICVISVYTQYMEFMNNPTDTGTFPIFHLSTFK